MNATIYWKTKQEGGRASLPSGIGEPPYAPLIRFTDTARLDPLPWSLSVKKIADSNSEHGWVADVQFLAADAPSAELRMNRPFELFEGKRCVATGVLIGRAVATAS